MNNSAIFRERLERVIARAGLSQAAFARQAGIDRSTLSQLTSAADERLPRAETLIAIASACRISTDWLLGLSEREAMGADIVEAPLTIESQAHMPFDRRFLHWFAEAGGHKLRTVPLTFPDVLKTPAVMRFEYAAALEAEPQPDLFDRRLVIEDALRQGTEMEACVTLQALEAFARGEAQWAGLDAAARRAQLEAIAAFADEHYPAFRLFLYDLRQTYSVPFTVFGRSRAAIYLGPSYLVMNASEHIRTFSRRFDEIIRASAVQPTAVGAYMAGLGALAA